LIIGFCLGRAKPYSSERISTPLVNYGIPLSVMGLLLKSGINIDLIISALISFITIIFMMIVINGISPVKKYFPNYTLQLGGLIGNTSFLGIPIAIAILPTNTINFTIGFDLGTTFFAWLFGPFLLQRANDKSSLLNFKRISTSISNSPATKGIIGVLIIYLLNLEEVLDNILWVPAKFVIFLAIIVVGTRLGSITKNKNKLFDLEKGSKSSIFLKLFIFPAIIFFQCKLMSLSQIETTALVLQGATPSAISTILMAEAYKVNQDIAAKILFTTTIISILTIPLIATLFL
tara:strand:+ start:2271 stop:3140 length:870 start_codon:yes stop_codon:yes gene_type:complete